jgi:hypothetical protein
MFSGKILKFIITSRLSFFTKDNIFYYSIPIMKHIRIYPVFKYLLVYRERWRMGGGGVNQKSYWLYL